MYDDNEEAEKYQMKKPMLMMLISLAVLFGLIAIYKIVGDIFFKRAILASLEVPISVSSMKVDYSLWQPVTKATGSIRAIKGVNVTTELAGIVTAIYFTPGASVEKGTVLVQLNADAEIGRLQALQASAELARITYERNKAQFAVHAVSQQTVDSDFQTLKNFQAQVAEQTAIVAKKTIRAPFTGRLGISYVNPGQYLNPGDRVTLLEMLDPIYVDFFLPQQALAYLRTGQDIEMTIDTYPQERFYGKITTINPAVDKGTRNVEVEATVSNQKSLLIPGMFAAVEVKSGAPHQYLTLPQAAISYNPYGDIVYLVRKDKKDKHQLKAFQVFVTTGDMRGNQVAILDGLRKGDEVVTSGQLKLKNNWPVTINNSVQPDNHAQTADLINE